MDLINYKLDEIVPGVIKKIKELDIILLDIEFTIPYFVGGLVQKVTIKIDKWD